MPNRGRHAGVDRRCAESRSRSFTKSTRELCEGPMRPRHVYPLRSGGGDYEIPELHEAIARAGALLGGGSGGADNLALRGFSFRLGNPDYRTDILTQNAPVHYARTLDQMLAFLKARIPGPDGRPDPANVEAFSIANPETLHQANYIAALPQPGSFADTTYWGVHSFPATNSNGETRFIKFKVVPVGGKIPPTGDETWTKPDDLLLDDLKSRVAKGAIRFSVMALLDRPGDPTMDVTIRWPNEDRREEVRLGTIVITGIEPDEVCDAFLFDPANLAAGIGHPPDEIFAARHAACTISFAKRS